MYTESRIGHHSEKLVVLPTEATDSPPELCTDVLALPFNEIRWGSVRCVQLQKQRDLQCCLRIMPMWICRNWRSANDFQRNFTTSATHLQPHQLAAADRPLSRV